MKDAKKNIFIESLGIKEIIKFSLINFLRKDKINIYYDEHRTRVRNCKIPLKNFIPANLTMCAYDTKGYALTYHLENNLKGCVDLFNEKYFKNSNEEKRQMARSFLSEQIGGQVRFITMVIHKVKKNKFDNIHILLESNPGNKFTYHLGQKYKVKINQTFSITNFFKYILSPMRSIISLLFCQIYKREINTNITKVRPSVWVEYFKFESTLRRNNLWSNHIKDNDYQLVYYMDRKDSIVNEESRKTCDENNFKWIDCLNVNKNIHFSIFDFVKLIGYLKVFRKNRPLWIQSWLTHCLLLEEVYYKLYSKYNVKILIQHQSHSWIKCLQANAIKRNAGILLGFEWSSYSFDHSTGHIKPYHVFCFWGRMNYYLSQNKGLTSQYVLPTGVSTVPLLELSKEVIDFTKDSDFTFLVLDSSYGYNVHQTRNGMIEFYDRVLCLLESNHKWRAILKSKGLYFDEILDILNNEDLSVRFKRLQEKNQFYYCSYEMSPTSFNSVVDLAVGFGVNSAAALASLNGLPSVHWDCSSLKKNPMYFLKDQKILYPSIDKMIEAIKEFCNGDKTIGDFSFFRKEINHFDDFNGAKRLGFFIDKFMSKNNLEESIKEYMKQYQIDESWIKPQKLSYENVKNSYIDLE